MSAAAGPPPPDPPQGSDLGGPSGHRRRKIRSLGAYVVLGDSDDSDLDTERVEGFPCDNCRHAVMTSGKPVECSPGPGKACMRCRNKKYSCS